MRVLGPVEAYRDGAPVALGGPRQRTLLGALALRLGQVVPADRLIEDLWGDDAPERAAATLRASVSHLRAAVGGPAVLVARKPGYVLDLPREAVDAERFEAGAAEGRRALAAGDPAGAAKLLGDALALWRGPALTGVDVPESLQGRVAGLEELRLGALEDRIEADLAVGAHAEVIGELEAVIAEHPLRERLRELQMLALYRAGRQADALRAYQTARRLLADELGLDPGRRLQDLEGAILRHDPTLDSGTVVHRKSTEWRARRSEAPAERRPRPATAPPAVPGLAFRSQDSLQLARHFVDSGNDQPFVGRGGELAALRGIVERAALGRGALALVLGEAGIGKTRLVDAAADEARAGGVAHVVRSRCDESQGAPAFWPWVQVVRALLAGRSADDVAVDTAGVADHLALLVPELRTRLPGVEAPPDLEPEAARFMLFDAVATLLARRAAEAPVLIAVDDLHWADVPSLHLLAFVARRLGDMAVAVVATCRDEEVAADSAVGLVLSSLAGLPGVERVVLRGLSAGDVGEYLASVAATGGVAPSAELVQAVWRRTGGHPFFMAEVARALAMSPGGEVVVPEGVRAAIGQRLNRVPAEARAVLDVAAVAGREFQLVDVQRAAGASRDDVLRGVGAGVAAGIVAPVEGSIQAYRFQHDLLREALYEALPVHVRVGLHDRLGAAIEQADRDGARLGEVALHGYLGAPAGDPERAADFVLRAAAQALSALAYEDAVVQAERAVELLGLCDDACDELRVRVHMAVGDARCKAGLGDGARDAYRLAADAARRSGSAVSLALAALGYGANGVTTGVVDEAVVVFLREALEGLGADDDTAALRARLLARMAMELYYSTAEDVTRSAALAEQAVDLARPTGDRRALGEALAARHFCLRGPDDLARRLVVGDELLALADRTGDAELALRARHGRVADLLELGDIDGFESERAAYAELADALHLRGAQGTALAWTGLRMLLEGRFDAAEAVMLEAFDLGQSGNADAAMQVFGVQFATLRREQDRHEEVLAPLTDITARFPAAPAWKCGLALIASEGGRAEEARALVASLEDFESIPRDVNWLPAMATLAVAVWRLGEAEWAARLYDLLVAFEERTVVVGGVAASACYGSVAYYLGLLAACCGRRSDAVAHFEKALARNQAIGGAPWVAHTQAAYAAVLGPDDADPRAAALAASARSAAEAMGMRMLLRALTAAPALSAGQPDIQAQYE